MSLTGCLAGTIAVRGGEEQPLALGSAQAPIFQTAAFAYPDVDSWERAALGHAPGDIYSRNSNPTVAVFEEKVRLLEHAERAAAFASGMAAISDSLFALLRPGDRVVSVTDTYGGTAKLFLEFLPRMGIKVALVDTGDGAALDAAIAQGCRVVYLETPTNPTLQVYDIAAVAEIAHGAGAKLVVDNVFATPLYQSPLKLGADVVVYSATKHIDGQGRVLGGCILATEKIMVDNYQQLLRQTGPSLSPFNAWVLLKGLETLSVRVARETEVAGKIADRLAGHDKLVRLIYPGRKDHPQAAVIAKQMTGGSSLIALEIKGGKQGAFRFLNGLSLIGITNNLGDSKSLITHPTTTTHQRLTPEQRADLGIGDGLVRLSVGLEHIDDLLDDLLGALEKV